MEFTYTKTYTSQENLMNGLNEGIGKAIKESFESSENPKYPYRGIAQDGTVLEEKPLNLYERGILIGDDFTVRKERGLDMNYVFADGTGEIHSFGEEFAKDFVIYAGAKVGLEEFSSHPDVEAYIKSTSERFAKEKVNQEKPIL